MQNEKRKISLNEEDETKDATSTKARQLESYEESRNVICFNCNEREHYANECSKSRQSREMKSSSITTQAILSQKGRHDNFAECVLLDQIVAVTIRSGGVRKKEVTAQVKKKKIILKRNERINEKHDKYLKSQGREQKKEQESREKNMNKEQTADVEKMSRMNQYEEFHDFENENDEEQMMKYSDEKSIVVNEKAKRSAPKESTSEGKTLTKMKVVKEQVKELIIFKEIKISNSIRVMKNKKRFDIQKMMNLMMSLSMSQLLNESQQLRKKFA
jgi:hypothetical protein